MHPVSTRWVPTVQRFAFGVAWLVFCSRLAVGATQIYWTDGRGIHRASTLGKEPETLLTAEMSNPQGITIDTNGGKIYWTDLGTGQIRRANLDGTMLQTVAATENYPQGIAIDPIGRTLYWVETGRRQKIQRADLEGQNVRQVLVANQPRAIAISAVQKSIYWTESQGVIVRADFDGANRKPIAGTSQNTIAVSAEQIYFPLYHNNTKTTTIYQADLEGQNQIPLIETERRQSVRAIAIDAEKQKIYWCTYDSQSALGKIHRATLDGNNVETFLQTERLRIPLHIEIDTVHGKVYWVESVETPFGTTGTIRWASISGTEVADLIDVPLQAACGIDVDAISGKLYWTDFGRNKIQRANLDGTSTQTLVTALEIPIGLAVDELNGKMYWTNWATGVIQSANLDGTNLQTLVETGKLPDSAEGDGLRAITLDTIEKRIYWSTGSQIFLAQFDGTDTRPIAGGPQINGVFVDEKTGQIFWTSNGLQMKVERANLDGGVPDVVYNNREDLALAFTNVQRGVTVDITTGKAYWGFDLSPGNSRIYVVGPSPIIDELTEPRFLDLDQLRPTTRILPVEPNENLSIEAQGKQPVSWGRIRQNALLQNYPNPFNPETWFPYQLAWETNVEISIYSMNGNRIRTLQLGTLPSGEYITKNKAAYWDGLSDTGERVSSGAYFYHFRAGDYSETRKMIILK